MNSFIENLSIIKKSLNNSDDKNNVSENKFDFDRNFDLNDDISQLDLKDEKFNNKINNDKKLNISLNSLLNSDKNNKFNKNSKKGLKKRLKKEDLNNIPLPIFSCIYCSNDYVSFKHLSNEIISKKYLFQNSLSDIIKLNYLISYRPGNDISNNNCKLLNIFLNNSEYLTMLYKYNKIKNYFKSDIFKIICFKSYLVIKNININNYEKKRLKIKKLFYSKGIKDIFKLRNSNKSSFYNFPPNTFNNKLIDLSKNNENEKKNIEAQKQKKNDLKILIEDNYKRKINKNEIEWEKEYYNVFSPIIDDDILYNYINNKNKNLKKNQIYIHSEVNIFKNSKNQKIFNLNKNLNSDSRINNINIKTNKDINSKPISPNIIKNKILKLGDISFIKNKNSNILTPKQCKKQINLNNCNKTPLYIKTKLKNLSSKSAKKLIKGGRNRSQKSFQKNIIINYTTNNNKELINNNAIKLKLKDIKNHNKSKSKIKNLYNLINNSYDQSDKINLLQNFQNNSRTHSKFFKKEKLLLNNNIINRTSLLNKSLIGYKNIQNNLKYKNKFLLFLKIKNILESNSIKSKKQNPIYKKKFLLPGNNKPINIKLNEKYKNLVNNNSYKGSNS